MEGEGIVERLLASDPSFDPVDAHALSELGPYAVLGEFAHHVVDRVVSGDTRATEPVFALVEEVLATGTGHDVTVVRNGFLETIQNIASHRDVAVEGSQFLPLLGPHATSEWHSLNETWLLAAADRPSGGAVSVDDYLGVSDPDLRRHLQANRRELTDGRMIGVSDVLAYEQREAAGIRSATARMRRITMIAVALCAALVIIALVVT